MEMSPSVPGWTMSGTGHLRLRLLPDHAYLSVGTRFYTLDHSSHMWKPAQTQSGWLKGADGRRLVYMQSAKGPIQLQWFEEPEHR